MALVAYSVLGNKWEYHLTLTAYSDYMLENGEILGPSDQLLKLGNRGNKPLIKNWLHDFTVFCGSIDDLNNLNYLKYLNESHNVKLLSSEELKILKRLLKLYSVISNPFEHQGFFQNSDLFDFYFEAEAPAEDQTPAAAEDRLAGIKEYYHQELKKLRLKYSLIAGQQKYAGYNLSQLINLLRGNLKSPKDLLSIMAALNQQVVVDKILESNQFITDLYYQQAYVDFKARPTNFNLAYLYRTIFKQANFLEQESAIFMQYLSSLNKNLIGAVYADLKSKIFKWQEFKLENNKIIYK